MENTKRKKKKEEKSMKKENYLEIENQEGVDMACESLLALKEVEDITIPDDIPYAHIENGVMQITPDIEEQLSEIEKEGVVSMNEFKNQFAKWLE